MAKGNTAIEAVAENQVLTYRRDHPKDRCSYGIAGVSGIVVFDKGLFLNGVPPQTITLDVNLALPKPDGKAAKAEAAAARLAERAAKAEARAAAQAAKVAERAAKAEAALAAAKAKIAAATLAVQ